jgi:homoserine O-succinyltransferase
MAERGIMSEPAGAWRVERRDMFRPLLAFSGSGALRIGLLNNMPDSAFKQTERQFRRLIGPRAGVKLFAFDHIARGEQVTDEIRRNYQSHRLIATSDIDALVITGCEPRAARLDQEPYFEAFAEIVDWARSGTVSTLFSCLAAHAAVLHLDGIERRPLGGKLSGVFDVHATRQHGVLNGMADTVPVPHSRFNGLNEAELDQGGYSVIRRSDTVGADLFVRDDDSLFVFLQGHPEYSADSLAREYRRDVGRYLDATRQDYPALPANYYPAQTQAIFSAFQERALAARDAQLFTTFPSFAEAPVPAPVWDGPAQAMFRNWLSMVARRRHGGQTSIRSASPAMRGTA